MKTISRMKMCEKGQITKEATRQSRHQCRRGRGTNAGPGGVHHALAIVWACPGSTVAADQRPPHCGEGRSRRTLGVAWPPQRRGLDGIELACARGRHRCSRRCQRSRPQARARARNTGLALRMAARRCRASRRGPPSWEAPCSSPIHAEPHRSVRAPCGLSESHEGPQERRRVFAVRASSACHVVARPWMQAAMRTGRAHMVSHIICLRVWEWPCPALDRRSARFIAPSSVALSPHVDLVGKFICAGIGFIV